MTILSRLPFLECLLDKSDAEALEQRFYEACERAGINPSSAYAEQIGIHLLADLSCTGAVSTASSDINAQH